MGNERPASLPACRVSENEWGYSLGWFFLISEGTTTNSPIMMMNAAIATKAKISSSRLVSGFNQAMGSLLRTDFELLTRV